MQENITHTSERELRALQLEQISAATLLKIAATLEEILKELREQAQHRNGTDLRIFSHSGANGAPNQRHLEHRTHPPHNQN